MSEQLKASPFAEVVTASDTVDFAEFIAKKTPSRRIRVNVAGTVRLVFVDGRTVDHPVLAGEILDVQCRRINSTGTVTASGFVVYY